MWDMRVVLGWVGAAVIVAGALVGGVLVANATVFSASAFVRDYLTALAIGRVDEALALPGVDAAGMDPRLLDARAHAPVDAEVVGDDERDGVHHVRVAVHDDGTTVEAVLEVERIGTRFWLFPDWGFAASPVTPVTVRTTGDARFTAGGVPLAAAGGGPVTFAALTPGRYVLFHDSQFLEAAPVTVLAAGGGVEAELDILPNAAFEAVVTEAVDRELEACTSQRVLFPVGCPFGHAIQNRVASEPRWELTEPLDVEIAPSERFGLWEVPPTTGVARLTVDVQSVFDGSVTTLEHDVSFTTGYRIGFGGTTVVLAPVG